MTNTHKKIKVIEVEINNHNKKNTMGVRKKLHNDKTCEKLDDNEKRKKTLEGRLERSDCDNQEVRIFYNHVRDQRIQLKTSLIPWIK